jgi:hypothetical protein
MSLLGSAVFTGSVGLQMEQTEVNTHVDGGGSDAGGTSPRVSLVPSVVTVRHSRPLPPQYRHQTACSGELPVVTLTPQERENGVYSHFN